MGQQFFFSISQPSGTRITDAIWSGGADDTSAWLQYRSGERGPVLITFSREFGFDGVQMLLHDGSAALAPDDSVPGFVDFSFEVGTDELPVALEGVGSFARMSDGGVGFKAGNLLYGSTLLEQLRTLLPHLNESFRLWVADTSYCFPIEPRVVEAPRVMFSPAESLPDAIGALNELKARR